jgi:preprotein translocase subunit YajC
VGFLIFLLFAFVLMWLLVVMPQRRRQAQQRTMIDSIHVGSEVLTAGGLYGDVVEIGEDEFAIEIAPGVVVRIAARAVATVIPPDAYEEDEAQDEEEPAELAPPEEVAASLPDREQQPPNGVPERP